jgi:hypothetical protein
MVTFNSKSAKIRVMKEKFKVKVNNDIFFGTSLTPQNRYLLRKAKFIAKNKKLKTVFYDGLVRVKMSDDSEMTIDNENCLKELEKLVAQMPSSSSAENDETPDETNSNKK